MKSKVLFLFTFALFIGILSYANRMFFRQNNGFCIAFLYSSVQKNPEWELPMPTLEEKTLINKILDQKFHYLARGCHCYAFVSEDQKYVIKFHHYPSHIRRFSWAYHPFSYLFRDSRKKIKEHNLERLFTNLQSYKDSYSELKEETGLFFLHINRSDNLHLSVTLVDKTQTEYRVSLDDVTLILQHKAELIFPKLEKWIQKNEIDEVKKLISNVIQLIVTCSQKGYVNNDPDLLKNYGFLGDRAINIDVGDILKSEEMKRKEKYIPYIKSVTEVLRKRLENHPDLLAHFDSEIQRL
jgi:hypothetical protein